VFAGRLLDGVLELEVVRNDETGNCALSERGADCSVDEMADLCGLGRELDECRDVLKQRDEVDFLEVVASERGSVLLSDDCEDGLVVELGVVEAVEQMDRARP
jgi:hypothetical protein